jgi:hypothetical protein
MPLPESMNDNTIESGKIFFQPNLESSGVSQAISPRTKSVQRERDVFDPKIARRITGNNFIAKLQFFHSRNCISNALRYPAQIRIHARDYM